MTLQRCIAAFAFAVVMTGGAIQAQRHSDTSISFHVANLVFASNGLQNTPVGDQSQPVVHVKGFGGGVHQDGYTQVFDASMLVEVVVTRFSTDAERDHFIATGIPGLRGLPVVGELKVAGHPTYGVYYAERKPLGDGGEAITLITDYVTGVGRERVAASFPVTVVSLMLDAKGQGERLLGRRETNLV